MGASRENREEFLWDEHQKEDQKPLEFTEENNEELFGIEPAKAQEMKSGLTTTLAEREVLRNAYIDVITLEVTAENLPIFKELRLKIVKNRTQGIEKWHKNNKAFFLAGGRFVDEIKNKEVLINQEMEAKLLEAEKYFENLEKEKAKALNLERVEKIRPFVEDVTGLDFSAMSDYDFDDYVLGKKTRFEAEQKAKKEEAERIEAERIAEIERQKAIEAENAKLKAEAEAKEKALQKERAEVELKLKQEREKAEEERKAEADRQAKIQAKKDAEIKRIAKELQDKKDAEIKAEKERLAQIEKERLAKLEAEKAPVKEQLTIWVNNFEIPLPKVANEKTLLIAQKFDAFKKWAKSEIDSI
jgi:colicin import membrane protein